MASGYFFVERGGITMRNWNTPAINELDVRLTASSGIPASNEQAGYLSGGWHNPTFNSAVFEDNGDCVIAKKDSCQS
jgi:hypothetical protein